MCRYAGAVWIDDETTWPSRMLDLLDGGFEQMAVYEAERQMIDKLCRENALLRIRSPRPAGTESRLMLLAALNRELRDCRICGYHCTRLHEAEIVSIRREGLRPLSTKLARQRIERMVRLGVLPQHLAQRLLSKNAVDDHAGARCGMVWLVFTRNLLKDEGGVERLFRSWGGEALYYYYEQDATIGPALRSIGMPAIIEAAVPALSVDSFVSVGERFLNAYLARRRISLEHGSAMEGHVQAAIPGRDILRIITIEDPAFEALTCCESWSTPLK